MKISAVLATHNELRNVRQAWPVNKDSDVDEYLYADNASTDGVDSYMCAHLEPEVFIKFKKNTGISVSHNPLFAMATGDIIILTGCNRILPENWVHLFKRHFVNFPDLMAACIYNGGSQVSERVLGDQVHINGLTIVPGVLMDVIAFKKEIFKAVGYYQNCFGLWGVEDLELSARIHRWCREHGKLAGFIPGHLNRHLGFDPRKDFDGSLCSKEYYDLKKAENDKFPEKEKRFQELAKQNFPYYSPY